MTHVYHSFLVFLANTSILHQKNSVFFCCDNTTSPNIGEQMHGLSLHLKFWANRPPSPPGLRPWCYVMLCYALLCYAMLRYVMLCYVIRLFVKHLSQGTIQRRSQRDRLEKGKVFWHLRELGNIS